MKIILILLAGFASSSWAQEINPQLQEVFSQARKEFELLDAKVKAARKFGNCTSPCEMNLLIAEWENANWVLLNRFQIESLVREMDAARERANVKLGKLGNIVVSLVPMKNQVSEIPMNLGRVIEFVRFYNQSINSCPADQLSIFRANMNDPRKNEYGLAISQVVSSISLISNELNAALAEPEETYSIEMKERLQGYDLVLNVIHTDKNGAKSKIQLSLLDSQNTISGAASLKAVIDAGAMIDGQPVDGLKRLANILNAECGGCKSFPYIPQGMGGDRIFYTLSEAKRLAETYTPMLLDTDKKRISCKEMAGGKFKNTGGNQTIIFKNFCDESGTAETEQWGYTYTYSREGGVLTGKLKGEGGKYSVQFTIISEDEIAYYCSDLNSRTTFKRVK